MKWIIFFECLLFLSWNNWSFLWRKKQLGRKKKRFTDIGSNFLGSNDLGSNDIGSNNKRWKTRQRIFVWVLKKTRFFSLKSTNDWKIGKQTKGRNLAVHLLIPKSTCFEKLKNRPSIISPVFFKTSTTKWVLIFKISHF